MENVWRWLAILLLATSVGTTATAADVVIIANNGVPVDSLAQKDIEKIFLGKTAKWPDKSRVRFAVLDGDVHKDFLKMHVKRTPSQFNTHWKKMMFTGKGSKPKTFSSEADLVKYVSETKGAIGYIRSTTEAEGVKLISGILAKLLNVIC